MSKPLDEITKHILRTLPDSIQQRQALLEALLEILPAGSVNACEVRTMRHHLNLHLIRQRELPLEIESRPNMNTL